MAFATYADVATRLGRTLTAEEQSQVTAVIVAVTSLIVDITDKTSDWATALTPVPGTLKELCVEKALHALTVPSGVAAESLGQWSATYSRPQDGAVGGVFLTKQEELLVRRVVWNRISDDVAIGSHFQEAE